MAHFTLLTFIIIGIIILDYAVERILAYWNAQSANDQIPDELSGLFNEEEYAKQQSYFRTNQRFEIITSSISTIAILFMFLLGGFALVNTWANDWVTHPVFVSLLFFAILYVASTLLGLPADYYRQFVIEEKFGFNKSTRSLFAADQVKSLLLSMILGGVLIGLIELIYLALPTYFWLLAFLIIAAFSIFLNMFYTSLIVPLFNKQTPLEEGDLRTAIEQFAHSVGFQLNNIYVMNASKRSTKANAYFSGLGPKKRVVLFDTLINDLTNEEIVAVLAHEIGHYKHRHTLQMLLISLLNTFIMTALLGLFLSSDDLAQAFNVPQANFHINLLAFGLLYTPISVLIGWGVNAFSRHNEYQADAFAANHGQTEPLISALKKLSVKSLSNLTPHPAFVSFYYSHPTLLQRIRAMRKQK